MGIITILTWTLLCTTINNRKLCKRNAQHCLEGTTPEGKSKEEAMKCLYAAKITEITNHMNGRFREIPEALRKIQNELIIEALRKREDEPVKYRTPTRSPTSRLPNLPTPTTKYKVTQ